MYIFTEYTLCVMFHNSIYVKQREKLLVLPKIVLLSYKPIRRINASRNVSVRKRKSVFFKEKRFILNIHIT